MTKQFVILEHRTKDTHWDFMLEIGEVLRTWAVQEPISPDRVIPARPLADHRPVYLDYEGEISGGRGTVVRLDRGTYEAREWSEQRIIIDLCGDRFQGRVELNAPSPRDALEAQRAGVESTAEEDACLGAFWSFRFSEGSFA